MAAIPAATTGQPKENGPSGAIFCPVAKPMSPAIASVA